MFDIIPGLSPDPVSLLTWVLIILASAVLALGVLEVVLFAVFSIALSLKESRRKGASVFGLLGPVLLPPALACLSGVHPLEAQEGVSQAVPNIEARFTRLISSDSMTLLNPTLSPDGRWIAFATFAEGRADIWVVSAEGGDPIRLTNGRHLSQYPLWFPAGDRIAFLSDQVAEEPGLLLYLMSIPVDPESGRATGPARQVSLEPAREYAISPDGKWIAYGTYVIHGKLQVIPSEGGAARTLFDPSEGGAPRIPAWSKDSRYLYFTAGSPSSESTRLMQVSLEGGEAKEISSVQGDVWAIAPDARYLIREVQNGAGQTSVTEILSPDGQLLGRIPLHRNMNGSYPAGLTSDGTGTTATVSDIVTSVLVSSLDDGSIRKVSDGGPDDWPLGWAPDSRQIFSHAVLNGNEAVLLSPTGGGPAQEIPLPAEATEPILPSADGRYLAYALGPAADTGQTVMVRRISDGETRALTHTFLWGLRLGGEVLGPGGGVTDGNDFLYVERHGGRVELRASPPEGPSRLVRSVMPGLMPELPRAAFFSRGLFSLGVHGDWVAFEYPDQYPSSAEATLFLSTGEGAAPRALASVPGGLEGIYWSHDRRWILAGHYTPQGQSFKFDLLLIEVTPDGTLASEPRILETEAWVPYCIQWLPDNETLAVFGMAKEGLSSHLWLLPISGEEETGPLALGDASAIWWAYVSPDGRKVAYGEQTRRGSSIWTVDFGDFLRERGLGGR